MAFFSGGVAGGISLRPPLAAIARCFDTDRHTFVFFAGSRSILVFVDIATAHAFGPPPVGSPVIWLLCVLTVSIGAPFAVLSASAPLLQSWYARVSFGDADNPYILYSASNLGSMLALLAYPTFVEPLLTEHAQSFDFGRLSIAASACSLAAVCASTGETPRRFNARLRCPTLRMRRPGRRAFCKFALSAIPSSLMLGATTYISNDVASVPFLAIAPLALYLLTFFIAFQGEPLIPRERARFSGMAAFHSHGRGTVQGIGQREAFPRIFSPTWAHSSSARSSAINALPPADLLRGISPNSIFCFRWAASWAGCSNAFLAPLDSFRGSRNFRWCWRSQRWRDRGRRRVFHGLLAAPAFAAIFAAAAIGFVPGGTRFLYVPVAFATVGGAAAAFVSGRTALFALAIGALFVWRPSSSSRTDMRTCWRRAVSSASIA